MLDGRLCGLDGVAHFVLPRLSNSYSKADMETVKKAKDWTKHVEDACRQAVSRIPGFDKLPEAEWLDHVAEGLTLYLDGIEARQKEVEDASDDGEDDAEDDAEDAE